MSNAAIQLKNLGALPGLGLKGPGVVEWLKGQSIAVPKAIFDACVLSNGAWIVRLGSADFLMQSPNGNDVDHTIGRCGVGLPPGTYAIPRSDSTFLLSGADARLVFAQACAVDFREAIPNRVILTRVAGVTCGILPELTNSDLGFRVWMEVSYADYLWDTLSEIVSDIRGTTSREQEVPQV